MYLKASQSNTTAPAILHLEILPFVPVTDCAPGTGLTKKEETKGQVISGRQKENGGSAVSGIKVNDSF